MVSLLSIGAVSEATGIPESTLRTWERRYGWPEPERTSGQQRVYLPETVERLRLVARALSQGHRPGQVLGLSEGELIQLVGRSARASTNATDEWMRLVHALDGEGLDAALRRAHSESGLLGLLEDTVAPLLEAVGDAWSSGVLQVFHEHFVSERLRDFLVSQWRPLSEHARGPVVTCSTLPGEDHVLGLHMAASVLSLAGCRVVFLGANTPLDDIHDAAAACGARALFVSISSLSGPAAASTLARLRMQIPKDVAMFAGGAGAPAAVVGVRSPLSLRDLLGVTAAIGAVDG